MLVSAAEMRAIEQAVVTEGRATWQSLMEAAGLGMSQWASHMLNGIESAHVVILVGPGNNGSDGLVIARHLTLAGANVCIYLWKRSYVAEERLWQALADLPITHMQASADPQQTHLQTMLNQADLIIDGLLGIGINRLVEGSVREIIKRVNRSQVAVLAIDIPSGIDADNGRIWGSAIQATATATAGLAKRGLYIYPGRAYAGQIERVAIPLPIETEINVKTTELNIQTIKPLIPERPADSHKDLFGRVMVVAGSLFYPGAAWMTARAAARSGAGVITVACARSIYGATSAALHEATYIPLPEKEPGALSADGVKSIRERLGDYKALVIGPGLGTEDSTATFFSSLLELEAPKGKPSVGFFPQVSEPHSTTKRKTAMGFMGFSSTDVETEPDDQSENGLPPLVIDADGLNLLANIENWAEHLREHPVVLTPHQGEMKRLLAVENIEDPIQAAGNAAKEWGVVVVLKGATTVIAAPDGTIMLHTAGNSALATAGTGDILAGLIGGLLAQGLQPFEAAQLGVAVHSKAGALAASKFGQRGVIAGDIIEQLHYAWQALEEA